MFTASFASVLLVIAIAFIFRSSVKKANEVLPEVVNTTLGTLAKTSVQIDDIITVNCIENKVELLQRTAEVEKKIKELGDIKSINALYRQLNP